MTPYVGQFEKSTEDKLTKYIIIVQAINSMPSQRIGNADLVVHTHAGVDFAVNELRQYNNPLSWNNYPPEMSAAQESLIN